MLRPAGSLLCALRLAIVPRHRLYQPDLASPFLPQQRLRVHIRISHPCWRITLPPMPLLRLRFRTPLDRLCISHRLGSQQHESTRTTAHENLSSPRRSRICSCDNRLPRSATVIADDVLNPPASAVNPRRLLPRRVALFQQRLARRTRRGQIADLRRIRTRLSRHVIRSRLLRCGWGNLSRHNWRLRE